MTTDEPTPQEWRAILDDGAQHLKNAGLTPAHQMAVEVDIEKMRGRLTEAVSACTDLAMDQAVLILENHRLRAQLEKVKGRPPVHLNSIKASRQAWADIAYDMWEWLRSIDLNGQHDAEEIGLFMEAKAKFGERLTAMIEAKEPARFGPHNADHGPNTWSPQPNVDGSLSLGEAVGQALGTASMCWVDGTGDLEFDSIAAARVYDGIMAFLADWGDKKRKDANESTAAKMLEKERWG